MKNLDNSWAAIPYADDIGYHEWQPRASADLEWSESEFETTLFFLKEHSL